MDIEAAIALVDQILGANGLSDLQEQIFRRVWVKEKYADIAESLGYDTNYVKDLGAKSWQRLSQALNEKVTKSNIQSVLRRYQSTQNEAAVPPAQTAPLKPTSRTTQIDWGERINLDRFIGRTQALDMLSQWINDGSCPLIAITGMAGIGKTILAAKAIQLSQENFEHIIWRSPQHFQHPSDFLTNLQTALAILPQANQSMTDKIASIIQYLSQKRCLVVLDEVDRFPLNGALESNDVDQESFYLDFLQQLCIATHQSTILITSREEPQGLATLKNNQIQLRSLQIPPLPVASVEQLLSQYGAVSGSPKDWERLTEQYGGNPLALQIVSTTILDFFEGNITEFLAEGQVVFKGLSAFLEQQWSSLTAHEQWLLYYLAIRREPVSFKEIKSDLLDSTLQRRLTEVLASLVRRSLILKQGQTFSLQTAVSEYATFHLINTITDELLESQFKLIGQLPLLKVNRQDYLQNLQKQLILKPILNQLTSQLTNGLRPSSYLERLLSQYQDDTPNYCAGNLLNLLLQTGANLSSVDLSNLALWEVDFATRPLHQIYLQNCDLSRTRFSQSFKGVTCAVFSPDATAFITGHENGMIDLWGSSGQQQHSFKGHTSWIWDLCWTANGDSIVSVSEDQSLRVWDVRSSECTFQLTGHTERIWKVICPTETIAVSCSSDRTLKIWDLSAGVCLQTLSGHEGDITALAVGEEGEFFSGGTDQTLRCWNLYSGECLETWHHKAGGIWAIAYNSETQTIYCGGDQGTITHWQRNQSEPIQSFHYNKHRIWSLALSPCHQYLMAGGEGNQLLRWDLRATKVDRVLPGYDGRIWSVHYDASGEQVITASEDNKVYLWDIHHSNALLTLNSYSNWACDVAVLARSSRPSFSRVISVHENGQINLWNTEQSNLMSSFQGHQKAIWAIASHPDATHLVSGSEDHTLRIWEMESGQCQTILRGHQRPIWSVDWSADGEIIASGSGDRTVKFWDADAGRCLGTLEGHQSRIWSVAISPDSQQIASGGGDRTIKLWDRHNHRCIKTLEGHQSQVLSLAYHPQGEILASAGGQGICKLWNLDSFDCQTFNLSSKMLWSVAWSPNGQYLAMGGDDSVVHLWMAAEQAWATPIYCSAGCIWAIAFGADSKMLWTGTQDGTIQGWEITTGTCVHSFQPKRLYEGLNIMDAKGLTEAQIKNLEKLGARS